MSDISERWSPQPLDVYAGSPVRPGQAKPHGNKERRLFLFKAGLLLVSTLALIPVMLLQSVFGAAIYVGFLLVVHVAGLAIFLVGLKRSHLGITRRDMAVRIGGLLILTGLLYLASGGLKLGFESALFWISLFVIWALHTAGAALLHLLPQRTSLCPFVQPRPGRAAQGGTLLGTLRGLGRTEPQSARPSASSRRRSRPSRSTKS